MRQMLRRIPLAVLSVFLFFLSTASPAQAQYFGRNKVQYKEFKFEVLKTDHFDIYFYEEERQNAARVGRMAERWYARLSSVFEHEMATRQPLVLYASHPDFEQTNVVGGQIGEGHGRRHRRIEAAGRPAAGGHACRRLTMYSATSWYMHSNTTFRRGDSSRAVAAAASSRCRSGSWKGWPSICRSGLSIRIPPCGCAMRRARKNCRGSRTSTAASSFRIGGARPSGRTSAASMATT